MGNVRLYGATSGYTELAPPAVAPDGVLTLPAVAGTLATTADVAAAGKILQVVSAIRTTPITTTSATFVDVTDVTLSIIPNFLSSKILVMASGVVGNFDTGALTRINLVRDSTAIGQSTGGTNQTLAVYTNSTTTNSGFSINFLDSPATLSSVTYKLQFAAPGGTAVIGRYAAYATFPSITTITVMEVAA